MRDREIAYEQNVSRLEKAWEGRIEAFAASAVRTSFAEYSDDVEAVQTDASETVAARLLNSLQWENVTAVDISDIAYEAVSRAISEQRASAMRG